MNEEKRCPYCSTEEVWTDIIDLCATWWIIQEVDSDWNISAWRTATLYQCKWCKMCFVD